MHEAEHADNAVVSAWHRFWERGDWWRAILLATAYCAIYELLSLIIVQFFPAGGSVRGKVGSAADVLIDTALPIVLGSIVLVVFAASLGWLRELFGP